MKWSLQEWICKVEKCICEQLEDQNRVGWVAVGVSCDRLLFAAPVTV